MNGVAESAFRRHYGHVYRYLRRRVGDHELAEDLTQEVFAAAAAGLPPGDPGGPPTLAWLYTVARRRFADEVRRRGWRELPLVDRSPAAHAYGASVTTALSEAIGRLPGGQRQVVVLKLLRGLPFAEIGTELGLSEAAAKMRFVRALKELRADLTERGIEP
jgi:RNA polymerase sigma-70 factor (ECF subfamily)